MLHIVFEYADAMSNWEWRRQECYVRSLEECKRIYGLGIDCEYHIIEVTEVNQQKKQSSYESKKSFGMDLPREY